MSDGSPVSGHGAADPGTIGTSSSMPQAHVDRLLALSAVDLDDDAIAALGSYGVVRDVRRGEELYAAGAQDPPFIVVLDGQTEVVRLSADGDVVVVSHGPRRFLGELNLLTGQRALLTARATTDGRILEIGPVEFRRLLASLPEIGDLIFRALSARRELLREGDAAAAVRIVGSRYSQESLALRSFANQSHLIHQWIDVDDADDPEALLAGLGIEAADVPTVFTPMGTLVRPTPGVFAEQLGLTFQSAPGFGFDLVVIGTGPAGLSASVYGASEGLNTVSLDAFAVGGQAAASSRIENYAGFPDGISGEDLATRTAIQAQRLGARLSSPCEVSGLQQRDGFTVVQLSDGSEIPTRAVIVASGARYRRLAIDNLEAYEGAGVYYAATDLEVRGCADRNAVVVGGGNSAGQAAIYLAQRGAEVSIAVRRDSLVETMSTYLVRRIEADPRIHLLTSTEVRDLHGEPHLEGVTFEHTPTATRSHLECAAVFCFIGADPTTGFLSDAIALDPAGFILTDQALDGQDRALFDTRSPLPYETSLPGVFAAGDVRQGSLKRVAAAVGEGSSAVRSVHQYLAIAAAT